MSNNNDCVRPLKLKEERPRLAVLNDAISGANENNSGPVQVLAALPAFEAVKLGHHKAEERFARLGMGKRRSMQMQICFVKRRIAGLPSLQQENFVEYFYTVAKSSTCTKFN